MYICNQLGTCAEGVSELKLHLASFSISVPRSLSHTQFFLGLSRSNNKLFLLSHLFHSGGAKIFLFFFLSTHEWRSNITFSTNCKNETYFFMFLSIGKSMSATKFESTQSWRKLYYIFHEWFFFFFFFIIFFLFLIRLFTLTLGQCDDTVLVLSDVWTNRNRAQIFDSCVKEWKKIEVMWRMKKLRIIRKDWFLFIVYGE